MTVPIDYAIVLKKVDKRKLGARNANGPNPSFERMSQGRMYHIARQGIPRTTTGKERDSPLLKSLYFSLKLSGSIAYFWGVIRGYDSGAYFDPHSSLFIRSRGSGDCVSSSASCSD